MQVSICMASGLHRGQLQAILFLIHQVGCDFLTAVRDKVGVLGPGGELAVLQAKVAQDVHVSLADGHQTAGKLEGGIRDGLGCALVELQRQSPELLRSAVKTESLRAAELRQQAEAEANARSEYDTS